MVFSTLVISGMKYIGGGRGRVGRGAGGREGAGWVLGVGRKPKAGNTIHKEANSSAMSSVGHRNCHSQPGRTRPISGPIDPVMDRCGFTGSAKDCL